MAIDALDADAQGVLAVDQHGREGVPVRAAFRLVKVQERGDGHPLHGSARLHGEHGEGVVASLDARALLVYHDGRVANVAEQFSEFCLLLAHGFQFSVFSFRLSETSDLLFSEN
jgi:hypothetical protein